MRSSQGTALPLRAPVSAEPTLLGLEHEFQVHDVRTNAPLDFRSLVRSLPIDGRRIDPSDPNALRCPWGGLITADGREAEIAVDPVACEPGFVDRLDRRTRTAHRALRDALPVHLDLTGYSTHLSVATPPRMTSRVASIYASHFSAPMMLLLDRRESPGLLVRTRPGRTELCGEYATGSALHGAAAFAAGSVLASIEAARHRRSRRTLPPAIDVRLAPAAQRTGWYVDRLAFGVDLYDAARSARLRTARSTTTAQAQLEQAWAVARHALTTAGLADIADLAVTDAMVHGDLPLPVESTLVDTPTEAATVENGSAFGRAIAERHRPWGRLTPAAMSWDLAVFAAAGRHGSRTAFIAVPRREFAVFLDDLDAGLLDAAIAAYLAAPANGSRLVAASDVERAALYDEVSADGLGPAEPRPGAPLGRLASAIDRLQGGHSGGGSRDDKHRDPDRRPDPQPERGPEPTAHRQPQQPSAAKAARKLGRPAMAAGIAAVVVVVIAGVALAGKGSSDASAPPTTAPPGVATPGATTGVAAVATTRPNPVAVPSTPTRPPTTTPAPQLRFTALVAGDDYAYVDGTCDNGVTPGRVAIWVSAGGTPVARVYSVAPPPGVTAYEMTWVGADRYEVLFPDGAVDIGNAEISAVADCSGATTRKSGPSLIVSGIGADIENAPVEPGTPVTLVSDVDERIDACTTRNYVDVKVQWGTVNADGDNGPIFASEPMTRGADGKYRVTLAFERYFEELMVVGTYQSTTARCDWGNG
ncbi:MAG: hypothetical protein AB7L13_13805 [Acidimicrobiia bacterium]